MALQLQKLLHRNVRALGDLYYSSSLPFLKAKSSLLSFSFHSKPTEEGLNKWTPTVSVSSNETAASYPKPTEIPWAKEISNNVQLIGTVGFPVEFKTTISGKALAWTRLSVPKSAFDTSCMIGLTFWDELAHVAHQHVEKGNRIYVSGRLVVETVGADAEKQQTYYKVVVQQLNFVENSFSPTSPKSETNYATKDRKSAGYANNGESSIQELWQAFFANPLDWWDNRKNKKSSKHPDFKHKDTGEALWVVGRNNPHWVQSQLEILDSRMESFRANEAKPRSSFGDPLSL